MWLCVVRLVCYDMSVCVTLFCVVVFGLAWLGLRPVVFVLRCYVWCVELCLCCCGWLIVLCC